MQSNPLKYVAQGWNGYCFIEDNQISRGIKKAFLEISYQTVTMRFALFSISHPFFPKCLEFPLFH